MARPIIDEIPTDGQQADPPAGTSTTRGHSLDQLLNFSAFFLHEVIRRRTHSNLAFDRTQPAYREELRRRLLAIADEPDVAQIPRAGAPAQRGDLS
jgi:hypothetical protein